MPSGMAGAQQRADPAAAVGDPQIELAGVRKEFGDSRHKVVAVEGADLTVGDGELFAILGPSGSGKTTVLRMVAGFEQPTAGTIRLGGVDITALPARRRDVNTVFQEYALFPHMTASPKIPLCGGLTIGVDKQRAVDAAIGDRERAALQELVELQTVRAAPGEVGIASSISAKLMRSASRSRAHQTLAAADGDADIKVIVIDNIVAANFGVHCGTSF